MTVISVEDIHTPEMIADETMVCIGDYRPMVTLAGFMRLCVKKSPYVFGGAVSDQDIADAASVVDNWSGLQGEAFDNALRLELAAVSRAFEIIHPDAEGRSKSVIPPFGPEWMADLMTAVADAMPSLTPNMMLHKTSMVLLVHLAAASHRKNGGVTSRPDNAEAVFKALESIEKLDESAHGEQPIDDVGCVHGNEEIDLKENDGSH